MKQSHCKDCEKREIGCHSVCEDYKNFREVHEKEMELIRNQKTKDDSYIKYGVRRTRRIASTKK